MTAVQMANSICIESKKKNMTSREMEAPRGRHMACRESKVWIPLLLLLLPLLEEQSESFSSSLESLSPGKHDCSNDKSAA